MLLISKAACRVHLFLIFIVVSFASPHLLKYWDVYGGVWFCYWVLQFCFLCFSSFPLWYLPVTFPRVSGFFKLPSTWGSHTWPVLGKHVELLKYCHIKLPSIRVWILQGLVWLSFVLMCICSCTLSGSPSLPGESLSSILTWVRCIAFLNPEKQEPLPAAVDYSMRTWTSMDMSSVTLKTCMGGNHPPQVSLFLFSGEYRLLPSCLLALPMLKQKP